MAPDQADAVLFEEAFNPGEFSLPDPSKADELIAEFEADVLQADELITVVDTMEQIHGTLAEAHPNSIDSNTATALGLAIENFTRGLDIPTNHVFAVEQFQGGYQSRKIAHGIAMEGMTDVIKKITAKIVKIIRKIMTYLYDTMQELVFGADNILRASQEIQERARAIAHKQIKQGGETIDEGKLAAFLSKDGKCYAPNEALAAYKSYCNDMASSFSTGFVREIGLRVHETLEEAMNGESKESTEAKIDKIMVGMLTKSFSGFVKLNEGNHHETREMALPFGEKRLTLLLQRGIDSNKLNGFKIAIDRATAKPSALQERKLETMNYEQIARLGAAIEHEMLFGIFKSYKSSKSDLSRIRSQIEKGCDTVARDQQSSARRGSVVYSVNFLKDLATALVEAMLVTHRYDIMVARNLLAYCDRSIKLHA